MNLGGLATENLLTREFPNHGRDKTMNRNPEEIQFHIDTRSLYINQVSGNTRKL